MVFLIQTRTIIQVPTTSSQQSISYHLQTCDTKPGKVHSLSGDASSQFCFVFYWPAGLYRVMFPLLHNWQSVTFLWPSFHPRSLAAGVKCDILLVWPSHLRNQCFAPDGRAGKASSRVNLKVWILVPVKGLGVFTVMSKLFAKAIAMTHTHTPTHTLTHTHTHTLWSVWHQCMFHVANVDAAWQLFIFMSRLSTNNKIPAPAKPKASILCSPGHTMHMQSAWVLFVLMHA